MILLDYNWSLVGLFLFQQSMLRVFQSHKNVIRDVSLKNKSTILINSSKEEQSD